MTVTKEQYLNSLRNSSAYPVYRATIGIIALILYCVAGLMALVAVIGGLVSMFSGSYVTGFMMLIGLGLYAVLIFFLTKLYKEVALMLVDISDSTIEANARSMTV